MYVVPCSLVLSDSLSFCLQKHTYFVENVKSMPWSFPIFWKCGIYKYMMADYMLLYQWTQNRVDCYENGR